MLITGKQRSKFPEAHRWTAFASRRLTITAEGVAPEILFYKRELRRRRTSTIFWLPAPGRFSLQEIPDAIAFFAAALPALQELGLIAVALIWLSGAAHAADRSRDYRLEVVDQPVAVSAHSEFNVKLTKTSTGQPVENATITRSRLEMTHMHPPHKSPTPGPMTTKMGGEVKLTVARSLPAQG